MAPFRTAYTFNDVLLIPQASAVLPSQTSLHTSLTPGISLKIPLLSAAMDTVTEAPLAIALATLGGLGVIHRNLSPELQAEQVRQVKAAAFDTGAHAATDAQGRLRVGAAIGTGAANLGRARLLLAAGADVIVIDTAHGHADGVIQQVGDVRRSHPQARIVAGNIATGAAATALIDAGADAVKVGIGPGSICTTREVAGVGVPQLTAIMDVVAVAGLRGVPVIADGGITKSGDIVKALAAGASSVMLGSLFGATDEAPGEMVEQDGMRYKAYRGMGSLGAMQAGSADRYFQKADAGVLVEEGVAALVPARGPLAAVVAQLTGGVRAGMGYCGAADLPALRANAEFLLITPAGRAESEVHDVVARKAQPG